MSKRIRTTDPDVKALIAASKALEASTSTKMLIANLQFLWDRFVTHPPVAAWWASLDGKKPR